MGGGAPSAGHIECSSGAATAQSVRDCKWGGGGGKDSWGPAHAGVAAVTEHGAAGDSGAAHGSSPLKEYSTAVMCATKTREAPAVPFVYGVGDEYFHVFLTNLRMRLGDRVLASFVFESSDMYINVSAPQCEGVVACLHFPASSTTEYIRGGCLPNLNAVWILYHSVFSL